MKRTFYVVFFLILFIIILTTKVCAFVIEDGESAMTLQYDIVEIVVEEPVKMFSWVPLDEDLMKYIYKMCSDYGIDSALLLALCEVETGGSFDSSLISETDDRGLTQINRRYEKYHCELVGIDPKTFDVFDPYDSILLTVKLLAKLRQDYFSDYSIDNLDRFVLLCYNYGVSGAKKQTQLTSPYVRKVLENKKKYE